MPAPATAAGRFRPTRAPSPAKSTAPSRTVTGRKDFELYGSGRTDAGVHALGQVAHLDVATSLPADTLRRRVNDELPADINILAAAVVPHRFHARHDAVARRYIYQVSTRRTAFAKPFVWWVKEELDLARMTEAAGAFVGMHDFGAFSARDDKDEPGSSSQVLLERLDLVVDGSLILVSSKGRISCGRWSGGWLVCWSRSGG